MECHIDHVLGRLAAQQHGHVTRAQLLEAGLSRRQIEVRLEARRLIAVHSGVYAVGHLPPSPYARAAAAVLACGVGAILSHASAATLWTMIDGWWYPLEVTAGVKRSRPGIRTHRCATLTKADTTMHYGIPVTSPARTLHDLTPRLTNAGLIRAVNQAKHARYLRDDDLDELLGRCRNPRLRAVLTPGEEPTRSALEDTFLAFTERHGLPRPHMNAVVHGYCVDAWFPEQRVIVEVDSVEFHSDRWQFEVDRDRDAETLAAGIRTVRITDERMKRHPEREAARLRTILGKGSREPAQTP